MINSNFHETLASAYIEGLHDLIKNGELVDSVTDPLSPASNFGEGNRPAIELINYSFTINDPSSSLFFSEDRVIKLPYAVGLFLWTMSGSDNVDFLAYYHHLAPKYSNDGVRFCAAFGKRLFAYNNTIDQISSICTRLKKDPASRRTTAVILTPEDNITPSFDYPCCIAVQYFLRNGLLHSATFMRAQSALMVLPYDAFLFMSLQCVLAAFLGVKVGYYKHIAGTYHIYESEVELAKKIVANGVIPVSIGGISEKCQPKLNELLVFERELRLATLKNDKATIPPIMSPTLGLGDFFDQIRILLLMYSSRKLGSNSEFRVLENQLTEPFKKLAVTSLNIIN